MREKLIPHSIDEFPKPIKNRFDSLNPMVQAYIRLGIYSRNPELAHEQRSKFKKAQEGLLKHLNDDSMKQLEDWGTFMQEQIINKGKI